MDSDRSKGSLSLAQIAIILFVITSVDPFQLFYYFSKFCFIYVLVIVALTQPELKLLAARMESKAAELLAVLKNSNLSIDAKVSQLLGLKSDIKQKNVPEGAVPSIFECLRQAIASQHLPLLAAGFSTLGHFLKRLFIQDQHNLVSIQARHLYPLLLERLGDHKERIRAQAAQAFTDLWPAASVEVEHYVLEVALVGKNPKAKEMSMIWLSSMTKSHGLLFRSYVPSLVSCLEDADSAVRDTAKLTVVELFQNAPARAKSDLKRQLSTNNVRKSIANAILTSIGLGTGDADLHSSRADSQPPRPPSRGDALHQRPISRIETHPTRPPSRGDALHQRPTSFIDHQPTRPPSRGDALHHPPVSSVSAPSQSPVDEPKKASTAVLPTESTKVQPGSSKIEQSKTPRTTAASSKRSSDTPTTRPSSQEGEKVEPLMIASFRDVEDLVRDMLPFFEGRESEENWMHRERSVVTLRRLTHGNAPHEFSQTYLTAIKTLLDGIFKVVNSLRTTLSTNGCLMVQDMAHTCGPKIDPMVEIIMQNLVKLCAGMKKITAQNGNITVDVILQNVTYTPRLLHHVSSASQDKNVQLRLYAAGWIKTLINRQAHHKSSIEHGGGCDNLEKCIKKGLSDANPGVREAIRSTFWTFSVVWPERANDILTNLDNKSRTLLEKDPSNPNFDQSTSKDSATSKRGLTNNSSAISSRSALKEAIAAQKKARLAPARSLPPRPESAQSALPEAPSSDHHQKHPTARTVPTGTHLSSLSSAPMRPAVKPRRPELARPATADPYASRRTPASDLRSKASNRLDNSPKASRSKPTTPLSKPASATRTRQKTEPPQSTSTANIKPKRLDFSKPKPKDHPVTTTHHQRSDSHDSTASQCFDQIHAPVTQNIPDHPESQASIHLASPPEFVIHPGNHNAGDNASINTDILTSDHQITPFDDQRLGEISRIPMTELEDHIDTPTLMPGNTNKQPEPVRIYEDPIAPVLGRQDDSTPHIPGEFRDSEMVHEQTENKTDDANPLRAKEAEQELNPTDHLSEHENLVSSITANAETPPPPTQSSERDLQAGADSPLPTTPNQSNTTDLFGPYGTLPKSRSKNNENRLPSSRKFSLTFASRSLSKHNALEELPTNEPAHRDNTPLLHVERIRQSSTASTASNLSNASTSSAATVTVDDPTSRRWQRLESLHKRRSISPRSQDPVQAREMLVKGIQRIQMKNMDILGYRKLQGLIEFHDAIFTDEEQYDNMLMALLDELQSPPDDRKQPFGRPLDLKTQVLLTVRFMLSYNKKYFAAYYPRAVVALLNARRFYEPMSHIVTGLESTMTDIITEADPQDIIDAVVDLLSTLEKNDESHYVMEKGMDVLGAILSNLNDKHTPLPDNVMERIGTFAAGNIIGTHLDIRRKAIEACVQLRSMTTSDDHFWRVLGRPSDNARNLLTYYNAKLASH